MKKIGDHRTRESWLTIVRSLKLKLSGNRRNQSRKTDYVSRFETRHDTTRSFDPRGKISAHTEGGRGATTRRGRARWHASFSPLPMRIDKVERVYAISPTSPPLVAVFHGVTHRRSRRKIPRIRDPLSAWSRANWLPTLSSLFLRFSRIICKYDCFFDRSTRIRSEFCKIFLVIDRFYYLEYQCSS